MFLASLFSASSWNMWPFLCLCPTFVFDLLGILASLMSEITRICWLSYISIPLTFVDYLSAPLVLMGTLYVSIRLDFVASFLYQYHTDVY